MENLLSILLFILHALFRQHNQEAMKLTTTLTAGLSMANTVASTPIVKRDDELLLSHETPSNATADQKGHHEISYNWAGAVLKGSDFRTVTGTFIVPEVILPADAHLDIDYGASAWVGLDGSKSGCRGVVMQTGLSMHTQNGTLKYHAWYQWYPNRNHKFSHMQIAPGDSVTLTITASSESSGTFIIDNNTKKTSVNHTSVDRTPHLCRTGAEWIVEDFSMKQRRIPFADFGSVTFTNASAITGDGTRFGPAGASLVDMLAGGRSNRFFLTNVTVDDSSVSVVYDKRPEEGNKGPFV